MNPLIPELFTDNIIGVCGNFNCDRDDDWTFKDGTECKVGLANANHGYQRTQCELDCQVS